MWHLKSSHSSTSKMEQAHSVQPGRLWRSDGVNTFPLKGTCMRCMTPTLDGRMAIGYSSSRPGLSDTEGTLQSGIELFTLDGPQATVLAGEGVVGIALCPNGRYVVRNPANKISMLYSDWLKLKGVDFDTLEWEKSLGGVAVGASNRIYVVHQSIETIRVFSPHGGKPSTRILCRGIPISELYLLKDERMLVTRHGSSVRVLENTEGDATERFRVEEGEETSAYVTVLQGGQILVAWVKKETVTIKLYNSKLEPIGVVLADFVVDGTKPCCLAEFSTGEIAFCTQRQLFIFRKMYPGIH